ncbi:MAG: hypothetical protein ABR549_00665 [Mycobacteriales bacterium]
MADRRRFLGGLVAVLVIGAAGAFLVVRAAQPPKPGLPYPSGQSLAHVRGNCSSGNELLGCNSGTGPRSFLEVRASGDVRDASDALFAAMTHDGWKENSAGLVASDFSSGGQAEDIEPVFCKPGRGCVGLFRYGVSGYVLAWWEAPPGDAAQPPAGDGA